jgi:hypothetical protein
MKIRLFLVALLLSVFCFGCRKKDIEDLYAQPLSVIQKCVQGKWKWYASYGGFSGVNYSDNTFVDIYDDHYTITYHNGMQRTVYFTWKRTTVSHGELETWVMWDTLHYKESWYFISIKDGTLRVGLDPPSKSADVPNSFDFVRIK